MVVGGAWTKRRAVEAHKSGLNISLILRFVKSVGLDALKRESIIDQCQIDKKYFMGYALCRRPLAIAHCSKIVHLGIFANRS